MGETESQWPRHDLAEDQRLSRLERKDVSLVDAPASAALKAYDSICDECPCNSHCDGPATCTLYKAVDRAISGAKQEMVKKLRDALDSVQDTL